MKMAGHYGNTKMTVKNLEIVNVSKSENVIMVKGCSAWKQKWNCNSIQII